MTGKARRAKRQPVKVFIAPPPGEAIPFDVMASLSDAITRLYPSALMGPGEHGRGMTLVIPGADRAPAPGALDGITATPPDTGDPEGMGIIGWEEGKLSTTAPDEVKGELAHLAYVMLTATEGAINYVEFTVTHPDHKDPLVVIACWSPEQTPHALRQAAEAELDHLRQQVADLAEWHDTKAMKARAYPGAGSEAVMGKAAQVHDDAAARLRALLPDDA